MEFYNVTQAFFIQLNEKKVVFILKSNYDAYKISAYLSFDDKNNVSCENHKILKDESKSDKKLKIEDPVPFLNVTPLKINLTIKDKLEEEKLEQYYYIDNNGHVQLLYPYNIKTKSEINNKKKDDTNDQISHIKQQIYEINGLSENSKQGLTFNIDKNNLKISYISKSLSTYLHSKGISGNDKIKIVILTADLLLCITSLAEIHVLYINNTAVQDSFYHSFEKISKN